MPNSNNDKTTINFIWCINAEKWGTMEKIIAGKELEIEDIIPNFTTDQHDYYYAQNVASWAINYPENIVRLIYHPVYINKPMYANNQYAINFFKIKYNNDYQNYVNNENKYPSNLIEYLKSVPEDKISIESRNYYEKYIQAKYTTNLTLEQIEQKYIDGFVKFEKEMHNHGYKNFQVINYKDLVKNNLSLEEIKKNNYLQEVLNNTIDSLSKNIFDYVKISINYFGFGYEKNLTLDMDITPENMHNNGDIEFKNFPLKFGEKANQGLFYTKNSYHKIFNLIINDIEKYNPASIKLSINTNNNQSILSAYDIIEKYTKLNDIPQEYYLDNQTIFGASHINYFEGKIEPIVFKKNYWIQKNGLNDTIQLDIVVQKKIIENFNLENKKNFLIILLILLPFIILIFYKIFKRKKNA